MECFVHLLICFFIDVSFWHWAGVILCFWQSLCRGTRFGQFVLARSVETDVTHTYGRGVSQTYGTGVTHTCFGGVFGWSFCTIGEGGLAIVVLFHLCWKDGRQFDIRELTLKTALIQN